MSKIERQMRLWTGTALIAISLLGLSGCTQTPQLDFDGKRCDLPGEMVSDVNGRWEQCVVYDGPLARVVSYGDRFYLQGRLNEDFPFFDPMELDSWDELLSVAPQVVDQQPLQVGGIYRQACNFSIGEIPETPPVEPCVFPTLSEDLYTMYAMSDQSMERQRTLFAGQRNDLGGNYSIDYNPYTVQSDMIAFAQREREQQNLQESPQGEIVQSAIPEIPQEVSDLGFPETTLSSEPRTAVDEPPSSSEIQIPSIQIESPVYSTNGRFINDSSDKMPIDTLAIAGIVTAVLGGGISWKIIRDLLDSPRARVAKVLYEASKLSSDQVGLHVKKNILDEVPKHEAAYNAVNSFWNALTLGYLRRSAQEDLEDAKAAAEFAKKAMSHNTVGKISGARTLMKAAVYGGLITTVGSLIYSVFQSNK